MLLGEPVTRKSYRDGKALLILSLLLGFAAVMCLSHPFSKEESAVTMAAAPFAMKQQSVKPWQSLRAPTGPQIMRARQAIQPVSASRSQAELGSQFEPSASLVSGRREMMAKGAAALGGLAAAGTQSALAAETQKRDGRLGLLLTLPGAAVSWVLFNILGPANEQLGGMNEVAKKTCKVMVVGNPCNTNALIALSHAPNLDPRNFHALTKLDENRAKCQLAIKAGVFYETVSNVVIWGNHSTTQVPDFVNAKINGDMATEVINDTEWLENDFTPAIQTRGGLLIKKWGRSSAASTAVSIESAIKDLVNPTAEGDWFSTAVLSNGNPYGIQDGLVYSFPCRSTGDGSYEFVEGLEINDWLRERMAKSEEELAGEKGCVSQLMGTAHVAGGDLCPVDLEDTLLPGEM